ncbi:signal peptide peptidase SppA [Thalassoglobus sp. JC818]|uniref:signal peptide peptidase SppA n=1 Tax=Thalassoglobus sp. JC818 TaxID=3232136 RepID=UPI00345B02F8
MLRRTTVMLALTALAVQLFHSNSGFAQDKEKLPGTVAVFDLTLPLTDKPTPDDPIFGEVGGESLRSFTVRINEAAKDDDVAAIVLLYGSSSFGMAQVTELGSVIKKAAEDKPVYAHADSTRMGAYAVVSGAERISLSPTGDAWINGIYGEQMYLRGLLDLVGVEPEFLTCGAYKSAAEQFMRKGPSEQNEEMTKWLYDGLYEGLKQTIANGRGVDVAKVEEWVNQGLYSAETAKEAGLTDAVETRDGLTAFVKEKHGVTVKFDKNYKKKTGPEIDLNNPFAALQLWAEILSGPKTQRSTKDAIAVVHIDGAIMLGKKSVSPFGSVSGAFSEEIRKALDSLVYEPRVRGVVVRVNSPGGSATASEVMLQSIMRLQEKKPVVVSMGDYAASGGYYVSCRASKIYASENTITGSIGVVAGKLATANMWGRIGINFEPVQRGARAGILSSSQPFQDGEREELQSWMDTIYGVFKDHVTTGREGKLAKPIDDIAGGRVYTGQQALELGLVDELGSLEDAISDLAEELELDDYEVRTIPRVKNFVEELVDELNPQRQDNNKRLSLGIWSAIEPTVSNIDPERVRMLQQVLLQLDFLAQERVMLTAPIFWIQ